MSFRIKKDDIVEVIAGGDFSRREPGDPPIRGRVLAVYPEKQRVLVEGVNIRTFHKRSRQGRGGQEGGIMEKESPIHISNVMLVDPKTDQRTRIGAQFTPDGVKQRIAKRSGTPV